MSEDNKKQSNGKNGRIISTKDLGGGRKQVTFSVDSSKIQDYYDMLSNDNNVKVEGYKIGRGSVRSRYDMTQYRSPYTSNNVPYTQALKTPDDPHKKIQLAVELYHKEPIVGTVIDLMVDFSSSGFTNECDDSDIKKLYDKWAEEIGMSNLLEGIFLEYYRSGNITIYKSDKKAKVKKSIKSKTKQETEEYKFPAGYTILNPMNTIVDGSLLFDQEIIKLQLNDELISMVKDKNTPKGVISKIPSEIVKAVRSGENTVILDPELTTRITRKKQPYERYASPFLERIFEPVLYKQKLRQMDMSTIEGLINQLVTVTVGNDDYPADDGDLEAIAELFQTPNKSYTIFWNHTLEVKFHKPEGIDTLTSEKYKQVEDDILAGIGVSRVLLDGQGANFSTAWISILSLIERLENAREKIRGWLEDEYKKIAEENGFKTYPKVRFNRMNLREDNYIRDVLLAMYDRGLIDEEDILLETGRDYESVIEMKKRNSKNSELFLPPEQPFQGGKTRTNDGREPGSGDGEYKERDTSPEQNSGNPPNPRKSKATAYYSNIEEEYEDELASYYSFIEDEITKIVRETDTSNNVVLESVVSGTIMALFSSMSNTGDKVLHDVFDTEISNHYSGRDKSRTDRVKREVSNWNRGYVIKLANDIKDNILENIRNGEEATKSVSKAFDRNRYRVSMLSQIGISESIMQAKIVGNTLSGKQTAIWRSALADNTCNVCRGLHGKQFEVSEIPPRPHPNCQCDLDFI